VQICQQWSGKELAKLATSNREGLAGNFYYFRYENVSFENYSLYRHRRDAGIGRANESVDPRVRERVRLLCHHF